MFHQELCIPYCRLKIHNLLLVNIDPFLRCLPHRDRIVHLNSGIEKTLTELVKSLVVFRFSSKLAGLDSATIEDRLSQRADKVGNYATWIESNGSRTGSPSYCSTQAQIRVECSTCYIGIVEALCKSHLSLLHIRATAQKFCRNAGAKAFRKILCSKGTAFYGHRDRTQKGAE